MRTKLRLRPRWAAISCFCSVLACMPTSSSDATSAEVSSATGAVSTSSVSGFIVALDISFPECDPGRQDCPAGHKCTPYASDGGCCVDSTRCVPLSSDRGEGDECTRVDDNDDCRLGLFCLTAQSGGSGEGTCVILCDFADPDACNPGACVEFNDGFLPLCRPACDPLVPDCPEGQACYGMLTAQTFVCLTSSFSADGGAVGDACETVSGCRPGLLCAPQSELAECAADLCCTPVCPLGTSDCPPPLSCEQAFDPALVPDYAAVGYCRVSGS